MKNMQLKNRCTKCFKTCGGSLSPFFINEENKKELPCVKCICLASCKARVEEYNFIILDLSMSCSLFSKFVQYTYGTVGINEYRKKMIEIMDFLKGEVNEVGE